jgi:ABC-2 type transport system permease protein
VGIVSWRSQATAVLHLCYTNGLIALYRSPVMLIAEFLTPFTFLFFLFVVAPRADLPFGIVGGILFTVLYTGNGMLNDCAYLRLERNLQQVFVASPVRPVSYVLGMALGELVFSIPALALFLGILRYATGIGPLSLLGLLGAALLTWLMATSLGFMISTFFRRMREIWPIGAVVFSVLSVLPPIFYPMEVIPESVRWVAFLAPSTFAAQLADRVAGLGVPAISGIPFLSSLGFELAGLVGSTLLFGAAALYLARWREP